MRRDRRNELAFDSYIPKRPTDVFPGRPAPMTATPLTCTVPLPPPPSRDPATHTALTALGQVGANRREIVRRRTGPTWPRTGAGGRRARAECSERPRSSPWTKARWLVRSFVRVAGAECVERKEGMVAAKGFIRSGMLKRSEKRVPVGGRGSLRAPNAGNEWQRGNAARLSSHTRKDCRRSLQTCYSKT